MNSELIWRSRKAVGIVLLIVVVIHVHTATGGFITNGSLTYDGMIAGACSIPAKISSTLLTLLTTLHLLLVPVHIIYKRLSQQLRKIFLQCSSIAIAVTALCCLIIIWKMPYV